MFDELRPFVGSTLIASIDAIEGIAAAHRYSVNVIDPQINIGSIDEDPKRLNVRIDDASVITLFTIG